MITIQELHAYKKLSDSGIVPSLVCPVDVLHDEIFPWIDEDDTVCLWCIYCNAKVYLGSDREDYIKGLLGR
jgi:hypothetical protein